MQLRTCSLRHEWNIYTSTILVAELELNGNVKTNAVLTPGGTVGWGHGASGS